MAVDYVYPAAFELTTIEQQYMATMLKEDPVLGEILDVQEKDYDRVEWEQRDITLGMMQVRGINGAPKSVKNPGINAFSMRPGYYGEFMQIDEQELVRRRQFGSFNQPINISDLVYERQDRLNERRLVRMVFEAWTLLTTGTYVTYDESGVALDKVSFTPRQFVSTVAMTDHVNSTPLADLRSIKLLKRGFSLSLDSQARVYANSTSLNHVRSNYNPQDLYGRRTTGLATPNSLKAINELLSEDNLPTLAEYDEGYYDDSRVFRTLIPDGYGVVVGRRPGGGKLGSWILTRNASNPDLAPGPYVHVFDSLQHGRLPRTIEVHTGVNMGVALWYPFGIIIWRMF